MAMAFISDERRTKSPNAATGNWHFADLRSARDTSPPGRQGARRALPRRCGSGPAEPSPRLAQKYAKSFGKFVAGPPRPVFETCHSPASARLRLGADPVAPDAQKPNYCAHSGMSVEGGSDEI